MVEVKAGYLSRSLIESNVAYFFCSTTKQTKNFSDPYLGRNRIFIVAPIHRNKKPDPVNNSWIRSLIKMVIRIHKAGKHDDKKTVQTYFTSFAGRTYVKTYLLLCRRGWMDRGKTAQKVHRKVFLSRPYFG